MTRTLFSSPILIRGQVLGVLQFVNKMDGLVFSQEDAELVENFAAYIGLAVHHAKIYDKIRRNENKTSVGWLLIVINDTATFS